VHVVPDAQALVEGIAAAGAYLETTVERAREELARLARVPVGKGVTVRTQVLVGDTAFAVEEHAKQRGARFLVMGASERPSLERWMLGSVAERTVRRARRPVVIVPPTVAQAAWPSDRPGRVVVALEGNEADDLLNVLSEVRRGAPCDVTVLHLYWPPEEYARLGLRGPRNLLEPDPDVVRDLEPRLRALTSSLAGGGEITFRIQPAWGEPASNIAMAVEQESFDLLVVGAHQRHGLARILQPPVAAHLLRQAMRMPIVCVPTKRPPAAVAGMPPVGRIATVLAPTDLSPLGNGAVAHAYALLRGGGGVVELLHVKEHGLPGAVYAYEPPARLTEADRASIEGQLRALVPSDAAACGITTHVSIIDGGRTAESIVQAAERLHVDVISLGSHGRGGVGRAVLGSVSDEVVRRAHHPVLVVR
jgi:nucleotide-binding universal stress UspA family protein